MIERGVTILLIGLTAGILHARADEMPKAADGNQPPAAASVQPAGADGSAGPAGGNKAGKKNEDKDGDKEPEC